MLDRYEERGNKHVSSLMPCRRVTTGSLGNSNRKCVGDGLQGTT
ncbi:hypothetical protein PCLA_08r0294 [Pseudomonas citronellolis]|nr:hypothetical protein PCLA_08r0294 [Pseudomonas citronellolis]